MAGFSDVLKNAILGAAPGDATNKVNAALGGNNDGHTTSGMDAAMQAHANKVHPVSGITRRKDGSIKYPLDDN